MHLWTLTKPKLSNPGLFFLKKETGFNCNKLILPEPTAALMKKSFFTLLQYIFFLGLGIFFVWLSVRNIKASHWAQIKLAIQQARHWLIVPVLLLLLLSHYLRAVRWRI